MQLQYWHLNSHHLLSYFLALAEMGNFVFQRQEASLSTGWGLGEAEENDPSLFHTQAGRVSASGASPGKLGRWHSIRHRAPSPFISFPGWMGLLQLLKCSLMCICIYIHTHECGLSWWILSPVRGNMEEKLHLVSPSCCIQECRDFLIRTSFPFFPFWFCSITCSDISCSNTNLTFSGFCILLTVLALY